MTPPNEKRRPLAGSDALKTAGLAVEAESSTEVVANAPTCVIACSPPCAYRCSTVVLRDAVAELVTELLVTP